MSKLLRFKVSKMESLPLFTVKSALRLPWQLILTQHSYHGDRGHDGKEADYLEYLQE